MGDVFDGQAVASPAVAQERWWTKRSRLLAIVAGVAALLAFNVAVYALPIDYRALGNLAYPGVFLITFIANATTFVPVPYIPVLMHVARTADNVSFVVLLGALGSVLGESVAYAVGRAEERVLADHPLAKRLHSWLARPWRAAAFLFVFAVPLNPVFDVAGLAAGALGVRYRVFFASVFLARVVRIAIIAILAVRLGF